MMSTSFCVTRLLQHERFLSYSMSGFSSRKKPKKMIGLNRVKDFLLLIIIMMSSEILTNFVDKRRQTLFSELENGKITRTPSLFLPFFFSSITLCHFYFLMKNDFNPVQTGLWFASCDREALRGSPSIISEPLDATATKITHNAIRA